MTGFGLKYIDVSLQDQTTPALSYYFLRVLGTATLAVPTAIDEYTVTLTAGHGAQIGEYLSINEGDRSFQTLVLTFNTNVITIDSPFDTAFSVAASVIRGSRAMNVNGSVTPVIFSIAPKFASIWDVTRITFAIIDNVEMDSSKFGGIAALTRGIVVRTKNGHFTNIANIKTNSEFQARGLVLSYEEKAPAGLYGLTAYKQAAGQNAVGVAIRLDASTDDEFQIIIQDDLTALTAFTATIDGHVVIP